MQNLALYLTRQLPEGLAYDDAAQLCQHLYCTVDGVPNQFLPLSKQKLADIFSELAMSGWIREQDSQLRSLYGAQFHEVTDKGHWIEVMTSILKKGDNIHDLTRGMELMRKVGFVRELKRND